MRIFKKDFKFIEPFQPLGEIKYIITHHSSRVSMTAEECHEFHQKERGWSGIAYNFFIEKDGKIIEGRGFHVGAHANGYNRNSLGICLTGDFDIEKPTKEQWGSFLELCTFLIGKYHLPPQQVLGHRELESAETSCPGLLFDTDKMREAIEKYIQEHNLDRNQN